MKIERTKNATRNIVYGALLKLYSIVIPFLMRTAMIYYLGVQYLGLNSLFASVLSVLNLAELGVGGAIGFSMYRPIADDDTKTICALMKLYRFYYRIIGLVIGVIGVLIVPFLPRLINGEIPHDVNLYVLYFLNLGNTVTSYWLFAYKGSILSGLQREDISSKVTLIISTITYLLQFGSLCIARNYYVYLIISFCMGIVSNVVTAIIVTKKYPAYVPKGRLSSSEIRSINRRVKDLFTSKIGYVIVNSADTIVISAFLGLTILAEYQNYFYILSSVMGFITVVFNSCRAGIGNSLVVESKEKNYTDFKKFTFIISWIAGWGTCCFLCLYQPFMKIWVGESLMLDFSIVICLCIYFFVMEINQLLNLYKDAGGMWHEDRFRPLVTAMVNLAMNLMMVKFWGLYGIIVSTLFAALFVGMPWLIHNLFSVMFNKEWLGEYLILLIKYCTIVVISCLVSYLTTTYINLSGWLELLTKLVVCMIVPNIIYYFCYRKCEVFEQTLVLADVVTKHKFSRIISWISLRRIEQND